MDYPEKEEFIVTKVTQILNYGVFVELLEYNNMKGFVHISNVSSSWVKNIRNIVKMNQVRVAKVLNVDLEKKQIDLSFAAVSAQMEKQKLVDFKQINREEKLIAILAKQENKKFDEVWEEVAEPLTEQYASLYKAFEKIALGEDVSKIISKEWAKKVEDLVEKNIVVSIKTLKGKAKLQSLSNNGVNDVKEIFKDVQQIKGVKVIYSGAGQYAMSFNAPTYKDAEKILKEATLELEKKAKKVGAKFSFEQENEKQKK